jgi:hypothetical protein
MLPCKTLPTCTNTSSFKPNSNSAHSRQVVVRTVSRLRTVGTPVVGTTDQLIRCHTLPHTGLCPMPHHCYGTHWMSAIRISKMAKVSVSFVGYLHNTSLLSYLQPLSPLSLALKHTHYLWSLSCNTWHTDSKIPWIKVIHVTDLKLRGIEKSQRHMRLGQPYRELNAITKLEFYWTFLEISSVDKIVPLWETSKSAYLKYSCLRLGRL